MDPHSSHAVVAPAGEELSWNEIIRRLWLAEESSELLGLARAVVEAGLDRELPKQGEPARVLACRDGRSASRRISPGGGDGEATDTQKLEADALQEGVRWFAPVTLTSAVWLCWISQAACSADEVVVFLWGVLGRRAAQGEFQERYRELAGALGVRLPGFAGSLAELEIPDVILEIAAFRLALMRFPRTLLPEILGYTLGFTESDLFLPQAGTDATTQAVLHRYELFHRATVTSQRPLFRRWIRKHWAGLPHAEGERSQFLRRVLKGLARSRYEAEILRETLSFLWHRRQSPRRKMLALLRQKAPFARAFHDNVQLAGRSLRDWFQQQPFDAEGLLEALSRSGWFDRNTPERSPFWSWTEFGGPMFGVFSESERVTLREWVESPEEGGEADEGEVPPDVANPLPPPRMPILSPRQKGMMRVPSRVLFHALLNEEKSVFFLEQAARRVEQCLRFSAWLGRFRRESPFPWSPAGFSRWLQGLQERVATGGAVIPRPRFGKEVYQWAIEQFAPAVLVDGCWLQRVGILQDALPGVTLRLVRIYSDEIGDGKVARNHPQVYRNLLASIGLDLPPIDTEDFIAHPGFLRSAFDLPAYLLAISYFPRRFLPELLGLNLAIEVSGLGGVYRQLAHDLEFWGLDATIVRLHQSIDNFSVGHAALAAEAVRLYLDHIGGIEGTVEVERHWRRIRWGYGSLRAATFRFQLALIRDFLRRFGFAAANSVFPSQAPAQKVS